MVINMSGRVTARVRTDRKVMDNLSVDLEQISTIRDNFNCSDFNKHREGC